MEGQNLAEMPRYQCHKKVWGLKIACVEYLPNNMVALQFHNKAYSPIEVSVENRPKPNNDFYYVVYEDGYHSFSPTKAFEDDYTLIKPPTMDDVREAASQLH